MKPLYFWGTALLAAIVLGLAALLLPYEAIGIETAVERRRVWLLTVWTAGVMAICFGGAGLLSGVIPLGVRDIAEDGSVTAAIEARREARKRQSAAFYNFAGWTVSAGALMILLYFLVWLTTGR